MLINTRLKIVDANSLAYFAGASMKILKGLYDWHLGQCCYSFFSLQLTTYAATK